MQKLKQLTFDRRPSAILKAWAPQPPPEAKADAPKPDAVDKEMAALQRSVTLGHWAEVKKYLAGLPQGRSEGGLRANAPLAAKGSAASARCSRECRR